MNKTYRSYLSSSSFKMAMFFTILLGCAAALLGLFLSSIKDSMILMVHQDANSISEHFEAMYETMKTISYCILALMAVVCIISFLISTFVVNRINLIAETARNISETGNLSKRISIQSNWDDLSNLAQVLNALLDQMQRLILGVKTVSDNIAHDLKTPLARLRNTLVRCQETLEGINPKEAMITPTLTTDLEKAIKESDHLLSIFNSLLRIGHIENKHKAEKFAQINFTEICRDAIELYDPIAENKEVELNFIPSNPDVYLQGDRHLLFQMIANLLDNAIKFSPTGGIVKCELGCETNTHQITQQPSKQVQLSITDQGPSISEQNLERVFQRLFQEDHSRQAMGSGLGLSLVKAVIDLHGGEVKLCPAHPGLTARLTLHCC